MKTMTEISAIISALWKKGNAVIRISISFILVWPLLVMGAVMMSADQQVVGIVTLLPLIAAIVLFMVKVDPLLVVIANQTIRAPVKQWYRKISAVVALELVNGVVLSIPSVADFFRMNAIIIILVLATVFFLLTAVGWPFQKSIVFLIFIILVAVVAALANNSGLGKEIADIIESNVAQMEKAETEKPKAEVEKVKKDTAAVKPIPLPPRSMADADMTIRNSFFPKTYYLWAAAGHGSALIYLSSADQTPTIVISQKGYLEIEATCPIHFTLDSYYPYYPDDFGAVNDDENVEDANPKIVRGVPAGAKFQANCIATDFPGTHKILLRVTTEKPTK